MLTHSARGDIRANLTQQKNRAEALRRPRESGACLASKALAVAIGAAVTGAAPAKASGAGEVARDKTDIIEVIEVYGERNAPYKARRSGDLRHAADLADSPQTMTILTQSQVADSGKTDLKDILASQAGITLGTGENGNAFGDRYIIRGHEARSDVFVDGVRDPGMTTRESFASEQIEITKGPNSTFAGRGSSGGAVNGITKQATVDYHFAIAAGAFGSDDYHRATFDLNQPLSGATAVRINLLHAGQQTPDRAPAAKRRVGGLISGIWEASEQLELAADYYRLAADDKPDLGGYFDRTERQPAKDVPVYLQGNDFLDTEVDVFTLKASYMFSDTLKLRNVARYGATDNGYVVTGARGGTRHATDPDAPGAATFTLSTHQGWQEVDYLVNQVNLFWETEFGAMRHQFVLGAEYSDEEVQNGVFNTANSGASNCVLPGWRGRPPRAGYCGLGPSGRPVAGLGSLLGRTIERGPRDSHFRVRTLSSYLMDTVALGDAWTGFFGVRHDRFDYRNQVRSRRSGALVDYAYSDGFWNGHAGIVRNLGRRGNFYLAYSTASNINGGESDLGSSCGYGGLCGTPDQVKLSDPERVESLELGTKWQLFDNRLLATAALFRMTKSDVMESVGDSYLSLGTLNTGKNRVEGVELALAGALTDKLAVQLSAALMSSEVLEAFNPQHEGLALGNFADDSVHVQLRYQATARWAIGASWTYKGEMYGGQPDAAAGYDASIGDYSIVAPSWHVVDIFAKYQPVESVELRLNVGNLTDETYWRAAYRSGAFMYLGDARSIRTSVTWAF